MKLAIIGFGIAGGSTLRELLEAEALKDGDTVDIYEPREQLGVGLAYQKDEPHLIVNSYINGLSLNPDDPEEFRHWLDRHFPDVYDDDDFVPRHIFGQYAQELYLPGLDSSQVRVIREAATSVTPVSTLAEETSNEMKLRVESGSKSEIYDAVFLAFGHPPYADYYDLKGQPGYVHEPFPIAQHLEHIDRRTDRVGVVGSSLTALDVMEYLQEAGDWTHPLTFYTLDEPFATVKTTYYKGELVYSLTAEWGRRHATEDGRLPLKTVIAQLHEDLAVNGIDMAYVRENFGTGSLFEVKRQLDETDEQVLKLQRYISRLSEDSAELLQLLNATDRQEFFNVYRPLFEYYHVNMPGVKMEKVWEWFTSGQLRFVRGLTDIVPAGDRGVLVKTNGRRQYRADVLINGTGFETRLTEAVKQDPLLKSLYDAELIAPSSRGDVAITWPASHPVTTRFGEVPNLFMSGFWIGMTQYPNNNVQRAAAQGRRMVASFKEAFYR